MASPKLTPVTEDGKSADALDAEAYTLEARAAELHAQASRLRAAAARSTSTASTWIPIALSPLAKKTTRALVRSNAIVSKKIRGRIYLSASSLDAFMQQRDVGVAHESKKPKNDDDALRSELGLSDRKAS